MTRIQTAKLPGALRLPLGLSFTLLFSILLQAGCGGEVAEGSPRTAPDDSLAEAILGAAPGGGAVAAALGQESPEPGLDIGTIGYDQGSPDAPVKIIEISDFGCGYCRVFNQETFPILLREFIETGQVEWKFVPFVLGMFPNGEEAALAGECAGEQGVEAFLRMRGRLFATQTGWRNSQAPNQFFSRLAEEEGLDAARFTGCLQDAARADQVQLNNRLGKALGVRGTPLFILHGIPVSGAIPVENFRQVLQMLLTEGDGPSTDWLPAPPALGGAGPSLADRVLSTGMGYSRGSSQAPVKVVEFSDFGCGYCRVFQEQTLPVLVDRYVETGMVQWTYVPFVLGIFPNGAEAAVAGECAGDQGQFEPMRRRLYSDQPGWRSAEDPSSFFTQLAQEEGLDADRFAQCLDGETALARVRESTQMGQQAGIRGTPGFFVNGFPISGALPLEAFQDLLDLEISSLRAGVPAP
ncbi:DsbA family protein [Gemmatimonadota bacterium]